MKTLRKIGAIVLAIMMIAVVSIAGASSVEDMDGEAGVIGEFTAADTPVSKANQVKIYKEILAYNQDSKDVNAPVITYTYTIAPGSAGKQVKDAGGNTLHADGNPVAVLTKQGLAGATITNVGLTNTTNLETTPDGKSNRFPITVDFSGVTWTGAGVYRYIITEHVNSSSTTDADTAAKNAAGIADGGISNVRYMDVYVKDVTNGTGYEIYGYTLFCADTDIDGTSSSDTTVKSKTEGFVSGDEDGDGTIEDTEKADKYYTFNLEVGKTLVGDSAKNDNKFPFYVNFLNSSVTATISIKTETVEDGADAVAGSAISGILSTTTTGIAHNPSIDHQSKVIYIGVPVGITAATSATVYETNNVSGTTYLSQYSLQGAALTGEKNINWVTGDSSTSNTATMPSITMNQADTVSHTIGFTNTLKQISPTGYAERFAPYALILIGGVALLIIAMKRRKPAKDEE